MQTNISTDSSYDASALEQCNSYIRWQTRPSKKSLFDDSPKSSGPAVTIAYQTGAGAHEIASRLAQRLQKADSKEDTPWTVFDHHLVEKVLEEHDLPQSFAKFISEDRRSYIQDVMEEFAGIRPPSWVTVPQVAETILHLADSGHVILVGRGANVITTRMPNVFHVNLIAPLSARIDRVRNMMQLTPAESAKLIARSDRGRGQYAKAHFHVCLDNGLLYHLVINTDRIPIPDAVELIADGARVCFQNGDAKVSQDEWCDLKH